VWFVEDLFGGFFNVGWTNILGNWVRRLRVFCQLGLYAEDGASAVFFRKYAETLPNTIAKTVLRTFPLAIDQSITIDVTHINILNADYDKVSGFAQFSFKKDSAGTVTATGTDDL